jgi:hypothetical protein
MGTAKAISNENKTSMPK